MDAINYTTFYLGAQQFSSQIDPRTGTMCIHSIHPYDETEYHWARQGITNDTQLSNLTGHSPERNTA